MLSLTPSTLLVVLRSILQHYSETQSDMLPAAGTFEREALVSAVQRCLCLDDAAVLSHTSITLEEWADALSERGDIDHLRLFDSAPGGAFSHQLQRQHRYPGESLMQEAESLEALLADGVETQRSVVSWLSAQTATGFMLGALLPQHARWSTRSLFDHANALWELSAGDIMVTSADRWRQLAQRLPSLPIDITAVSTSALGADTYRTLLAKGVANIIELHCQPGLGVLAARRSRQAPFELLTHWHPTESDDYLLRLVPGRIPEEVQLAEPLRWVGARHFLPTLRSDLDGPSKAPSAAPHDALPKETLPAWQVPVGGARGGTSAV